MGAIEWHGEHNAVGLDTLKAHAVCVRAAQQSGGVVAPDLYWATDSREDLADGTYLTGGIEHGERYHVPGNMFSTGHCVWLRPDTYYNLLLDIYETMRRRGFRAIVVMAGHWSGHTLPTVRASGAEFLARHPAMRWLLVTDQEVVPDMHYPHTQCPVGEHAAGGETSLLMHIRPDLADLSKTFETDGALRPYYAGQPAHLRRRRETSYKYIGVLTCSVMWHIGEDDGSNDPETTASPERGAQLLAVIAERIAARARALLAAPTARQPSRAAPQPAPPRRWAAPQTAGP